MTYKTKTSSKLSVQDYGDKYKVILTNDNFKYRGFKWVSKPEGSICEAETDLENDLEMHVILNLGNFPKKKGKAL